MRAQTELSYSTLSTAAVLWLVFTGSLKGSLDHTVGHVKLEVIGSSSRILRNPAVVYTP